MNWLVTGGAGYIGSHVCKELLESGHGVIAYDNLSTSDGSRISNECELIIGDIRDSRALENVFTKYKIASVMHLGALKSPEESMSNPNLYMENNLEGTKTLIDAAITSQVELFIQSSSSSVYGDLAGNSLREDEVLNPISPYGISKLGSEKYLQQKIKERKLSGASLRYFNVVSHQSRKFADKSSFNLFPSLVRAIENKTPPTIYGRNYGTPDGTCIRDYVHVSDVARAHLKVAESLMYRPSEYTEFNVGTGRGYSVLEIVNEFLSAMNSRLEPEYAEPRAGDPERVIADVRRIQEQIGFITQHDLRSMIAETLL